MDQTLRACPNCQTQLPSNAAFCYVCGAATPAAIDRNTGEYVTPESTGVTMNDLLPRLRALLAPTYELGDRIGAGGFAEVFRARDLRLKRDVAVKVTRPDFAVNPQMMLRFRREAETVAALRHPHIMPIYDIGDAAGLAYIVMPYVRGESLATRLEREGRLPPELARQILLQAADALAAAHDCGVVHRDVKPDNILLDRREDHVLLMDFGIAKAIEGGPEVGGLTSTGLVMGTPHYMSPEQAAGERNVDARADLYALGVIGYRMLAGALPFDGPTVRAVLAKQLIGQAAPLREAAPDAPAVLVAAIERAMAKEPDDRFPTVRAFIAELRADPSYAEEVLRVTGAGPRYTSGTGAPAVPPAPTPAPRRSFRWVAALLVTLGAVAGAVAYRGRGAPFVAPRTVDTTLSAAHIARAAALGADSAPLTATADSATAPDSATADSAAAQRRADSVLVRRAKLAYGTPQADTFLKYMALSAKQSCERRLIAGRTAGLAPVCAAEALLGRTGAQRTLGALAERAGKSDSAAYWYALAAPRDAESALRLARLLDASGVPANVERATAQLTQAATHHAPANFALGARRLRDLPGLRRDEREAARWFEQGTAATDVRSMVALGELLYDGRGVKKNEERAASLWTVAAAKGDSAAAYWLGRAYLDGRGVPKQRDVAVDWLRKAAARGHEGARYELTKRGIAP